MTPSTMIHAVTTEEAERLKLREQALDRFKRRYAHNSESRRAMIGGLRRLATSFSDGSLDETTFPWEVIVDDDLAELMWATVADRYARSTATKDASALRQMLDCCRRVGLLTYEEARQAASFTANRGQERDPAGRYLSEEDLSRILQTCQTGSGNPNTRIRDTALVSTLATSGARGNEVTGVDLKHVHLDDARLWLTRTKGGRQRNAWLHPVAVHAIQDWLVVRGHTPGALFVPMSRTGRPLLEHGPLSTHQARKVIRSRALEAGIDGIALHDLRRFLISALLEKVDVTLVAAVVGHRDPATTAGYDRRPLRHQREAVASLALPTLESLRATTT